MQHLVQSVNVCQEANAGPVHKQRLVKASAMDKDGVELDKKTMNNVIPCYSNNSPWNLHVASVNLSMQLVVT